MIGTIHKGKITIAKYMNAHDKSSEVHIMLEDNDSMTVFCEIEMSVEDFGYAILGMGLSPMKFTVRAERVGLQREIKTELIPLDTYSPSDEQIDEILKKYEVDGWMARKDDFKNFHRYFRTGIGENSVSVSFERYVEKPDEQ